VGREKPLIFFFAPPMGRNNCRGKTFLGFLIKIVGGKRGRGQKTFLGEFL
jgi:hypothetical protein